MITYRIVSETPDEFYCIVTTDLGATVGTLVPKTSANTKEALDRHIYFSIRRNQTSPIDVVLQDAIRTKTELIVDESPYIEKSSVRTIL